MSSIKSRSRLPIGPVILGVLLVASLVFGGYYFKEYQDLRTNSSKTAEQRNEELIAAINKVYELPKDETPVVAIVSDEAKFKEEYPVFTTARKDDSLLLYEKAGQAILFRESENRVIGTATFAIRKGSAVQIIATTERQNSTEQTLVSAFTDQVRVASKSTPAGQYSVTTVVDLTGQKTDLAKSIATAVGGTIATTLPAGEKADEGTEIVVIVANVLIETTLEATP